MHKTLNITEARQQLMELATALEDEHGVVEITRRGKKVMVLLSAEEYAAIQETMEIAADAPLMASIERGLEDARKGRVQELTSVRKRLGI